MEIKYIRHLLPEAKEYLLSRGEEPDLPLKTLPKFNDFVFGVPRKALTVIGARTSEGKSSFATQIAYDLAMQDKTVLFLSLEMSNDKVMTRLLCHSQRFNNIKAFRGGLKKEMGVWDRFSASIQDKPLIINDMLGKQWEDIDEIVETTDIHPACIIVDYIQTIAKQIGKNQLDIINEYIRHFREMAIRRDFAGIICSQINRSAQDSDNPRPRLHHLKSSGFLEEHADMVFLLSYPYKTGHKDKNKFTVYVDKNRDGQTGYIDLNFLPEYYLFEDAVEKKESQNVIAEFKPKDWQE